MKPYASRLSTNEPPLAPVHLTSVFPHNCLDLTSLLQFHATGTETKSSLPDRRSPGQNIAMPAAADESKRKAARETIDILHEISTLLVRVRRGTAALKDGSAD